MWVSGVSSSLAPDQRLKDARMARLVSSRYSPIFLWAKNLMRPVGPGWN